MKVWEKITTFDDCKGWTKEQVRSKMLELRILACEENEEYQWVDDDELTCDKVAAYMDCEKCLDRFLDMEVAE